MRGKPLDVNLNEDVTRAIPEPYRHLVVDRGNAAAWMRTERFVTELEPRQAGVAYRYRFDPATVGDPAQSCFEAMAGDDFGADIAPRPVTRADDGGLSPRHKAVRGRWVDPSERTDGDADQDNLFGRNGAFLVSGGVARPAGLGSDQAGCLAIPRIDDPSDADFAFYGCRLLRHGDVIGFDEPLPLFTSNRSANYAHDYLLESSGIYVETHDIIHIHQPMDAASGGYWVLGREIGPDLYGFSALKIPFGTAAVMPPGVIHNDVYLTGRYRAVYGSRRSRALRNSSVILRDARDGARLHMI